uniref:Putative ovule protein n=1 Tax=Solanum chacoense TaxID=4108 RepID=A0A0V0GP95_SOLCH
MLYMMGRDDIAVGMGGEGGILPNGTILPDVGGYLPIIDQGYATAGYCRYRQAVPVGLGGRLDIDSNYGFRKSSFHRARDNILLLDSQLLSK